MSHEEEEVALLQRGNPDKAFLVRESTTDKNALVISSKYGDEITKYKVKRNDSGGYTFSGCTFPSLSKYIKALQHHSHITVPCNRDNWECGRRLKTYREEQIAVGLRSVIYKGEWDPDERPGNCGRRAKSCAVRELSETSRRKVPDIENLLACAKLLKTLNHPQIIQLLGVRTTGPHFCVATEFMINGSLDEYLRTEGSGLGESLLLSIAKQICKGARYLSEDMLIVHRNLMARNVLIGANPVADVRVTGFSAALAIPPGSSFINGDETEQLPIRWLAPESLTDLKFSVKSDVWSFGIVLFELMTHGKTPYSQMTHQQVKEMVGNGWQMPKAEECPDDVYKIMSECWLYDVNARKTFLSLEKDLEKLVMERLPYK
jgi:fyn-related kinase